MTNRGHNNEATGRRSVERASFVEHVFNVTVNDEPWELINAVLLSRFLGGSQRFARTVAIDRVRRGATLLPPGYDPQLQSGDARRTVSLASGREWTALAQLNSDRSGRVTVIATSDKLARATVALATRGAADKVQHDDHVVPIGTWHSETGYPHRNERHMTVQTWDEIRRNYSSPVAAAIDRLMGLKPADIKGRLLLLHGPPGTGKTTALRALAHAWRDWCQLDFVLDPERMFDSTDYLLATAVDSDSDSDSDSSDEADRDAAKAKKWRLLVLEDCDELVRASAKDRTGQALARLLNLTDGILGQGTRLLVAITTNERLNRLHAAIVRPGRCLGEIEVGRLTPAEARAWLGRSVPVDAGGVTLAELIAVGDRAPIVTRERPRAAGEGQYL